MTVNINIKRAVLCGVTIACGVIISIPAAASESLPEIREDPAWEGRIPSWYRWWSKVDLAEQAREQYAAEDYRAAARTYERMANLASREQNAAWAMVRRAEANYAADRLVRAADNYRTAIEQWPGEIEFENALGRLREIAEVFATEKDSLLWVIPVSQVHRAIELYEFIVAEAAGSPETPNRRMRLAELQLEAGRNEKAMETYRRAFSRHPQSESAARARIEYIKLKLEQARQHHDKPELMEKVVRETGVFLRHYSEHALAEKAQELKSKAENRLAVHNLELAEFYLHPVRFNPSAARRYLGKIIDQYPDTEQAEQARQKLQELDAAVQAKENGSKKNPSSVGEDSAENDRMKGNPGNPDRAGETGNPEQVLIKAGENGKRLLPVEEVALPSFSSLAVIAVKNPSREPELGTVLKRQLNEEIMREETVSLVNPKEAEIMVELRVEDFYYGSTASAKIRDEDEIPDELSAHTTTLYTAYLNVAYRVVDKAGNVFLDWRPMEGRSDFPRMPDMTMSREVAIRQASSDAAGRIVQAIVESW